MVEDIRELEGLLMIKSYKMVLKKGIVKRTWKNPTKEPPPNFNKMIRRLYTR